MHPLKRFLYCPVCGSRNFVENDFKSKKCIDCGFVYYFNPAAATAAFILDNENRLLVAKRAFNPKRGMLDLPGGFCDLEETAEEAIEREVLEETGLSLHGFHYLFSFPNIYPFSGFDVHTVDLFFEIHTGKIRNIRADDDVADLSFYNLNELDPDLFGLDSVKKAVKYWLKQTKMRVGLL